MSNDNKRLLKYLGILYIVILLLYKLPHDSYCISQYIIQPIRIGDGGTIFLYGIIPLILLFISIRGIMSLERYAKKSKLLILLAILIIIIPLMNWTLAFTRSNYHWIMKDGLNALDIKEANINLQGLNDTVKLDIELEIIDYSRSQNEFRIRVYLPKSLSECIGKEFCELEPTYITRGNRSTLEVNEQIEINLNKDTTLEKLNGAQWFWEDVNYELYDDKQVIKIIDHGL